MAKLTLVEAINQALNWSLTHDPEVVLLGEDIGVNGGVFRATAGLQQRHGKLRVQDTPLAEGLIAGMSIGMAAQGLKPVAVIQFMGFIYPALDQICNHMARMRNRTRGRITLPIVMRMPHGGGIHAPEHHSESLEALLCHHAGLRVLCPSSPAQAYGLLLAAIRDPDPVMFLEPTRLYRLARQEVPDDGVALPLDQCHLLRAGDDVTVVSWGAITHEVLLAAEQLAAEQIQQHSRFGGAHRPPGHRARGCAQLRLGRGDRRHRGRTRAVQPARAHLPHHRLRYGHALFPLGTRLHPRRGAYCRWHPYHGQGVTAAHQDAMYGAL